MILPLLLLAATLSPPVATYQIVAKDPHATSSYTEGFFYRDGAGV